MTLQLISLSGNKYELNVDEENFLNSCENQEDGFHCLAFALATNRGDADWLAPRLDDSVIYSSQMTYDNLEGREKVEGYIRRRIALIHNNPDDVMVRAQLALFIPGLFDQGVLYPPGVPCCMVYQRNGGYDVKGLGNWRYWIKFKDSGSGKIIEMHSGTLPNYSGIEKTPIFPGIPADQLAGEIAHLPPKVNKDSPLRFTLYVSDDDHDLAKVMEESIRKVITGESNIEFDVIDRDVRNPFYLDSKSGIDWTLNPFSTGQ